jgi:hypothetical protein
MQQKPGTSPKRVILARELAQALRPSGSSMWLILRECSPLKRGTPTVPHFGASAVR